MSPLGLSPSPTGVALAPRHSAEEQQSLRSSPPQGPPRARQTDVVSQIVKWCRSCRAEPIPPEAVPGTIDRERSLLSALGGVARALPERVGHSPDRKDLPAEVQAWLEAAPEPPSLLIEKLVASFSRDSDPLALVYEQIVASPRRRRLGTFFTPTPVLDYMKGILEARLPVPPRSIADPGAGVGAFSSSALTWWQDIAVHAVDVNLVTLGLLATRPDLGNEPGRNMHIWHEDFLSWLSSSWPQLPGPRLILGNPPYTRHQQLTSEEKKRAQESAGDISPDLRAGLSTYFLASGLRALHPQDSLCLLLPVNWLEADYAKPVRKRLWDTTKRRVELHLFPNHLEVFPGTQVAAMVIFVGPEFPTVQPMAVFQVAGHAADGFTASRGAVVNRNSPLPNAFTTSTLTQSSTKKRTREPTVPLAQLVSIRRGVATGANRFFLRTASEKADLPEDSCVRAVSRLRDLPAHTLGMAEHNELGNDGVRCWLLYLSEQHMGSPKVKVLLQDGEAQKIHERHLCKTRPVWYALEKIVAPDLLIGPMGKDRFRIVINDVKAIPTNTLYGLRLRDGDENSIRRLAEWMSSDQGQDALRVVARQHGDGLLKLEPGPLGTVRVPARILNTNNDSLRLSQTATS